MFQQILNQLGRWVKEGQREFNIDTYEMLHCGMSNQGRICSVNRRTVESAIEQRDM